MVQLANVRQRLTYHSPVGRQQANVQAGNNRKSRRVISREDYCVQIRNLRYEVERMSLHQHLETVPSGPSYRCTPEVTEVFDSNPEGETQCDDLKCNTKYPRRVHLRIPPRTVGAHDPCVVGGTSREDLINYYYMWCEHYLLISSSMNESDDAHPLICCWLLFQCLSPGKP